ncbi:hypothetical protein K439DRAFT_1355395 [Ramaria rubella]|nr:hypothetical protein K439DRAFT_1355395 [Ramaria rubella]
MYPYITDPCAVVLHPCDKTLYFQRQKWPESWIDTAVKLLRDQWEQNYKPTWCESSNPSQVSDLSACLDSC